MESSAGLDGCGISPPCGFADQHGSTPGAAPPVLGLHLLAGLNYEIRTPLTGILGMADLLLESGLNEEQIAWVRATRDCAESLFALLSLTLEYATLESGSAQLDEAPFVLRDALGPALRLQPEILPPHDLDQLFFGDACRLRQLVLMLMQHVSRFGPGDTLIRMRMLEPGHGTSHLEIRLPGGVPSQADRTAGCFEHAVTAASDTGQLRRVLPGLLSFALIRRLATLLRGEVLSDAMRICVPLRTL